MTAARRDLLIAVALTLVLALVPLLIGTRYIITQMTLFFIWAIVVSQWNLVLGVAGIFSLAQMALFAVGAAVSLLTGRSALYSGARQLGIGVAAAGVTYLVGNLIGVNV